VANPRVGIYYSSGALIILGLAVFWWPWGAFLLWPAVSLGTMAAAYFGLGPGIFRKENGRLPWTAWWTLGPVLFGQELSRLYYRRQSRAWDGLTPRVWIGRTLNRREAAAAVQQGVTAVLDLTAEFSEPAPFRGVTYVNIPVLDLTAPTMEQLEEMAAFIAGESTTGIVYVHCKIGYSRTAAAAAAFLIRAGIVAELSEAVDLLRRVRPAIIIRPEVIRALREFLLSSRAERSAVEGPR
jgi:protein phosphatase